MNKALLMWIILLLIPIVHSLEGKMPLLAVRETGDGFVGSKAELFLEIKEGSGRVFVDTFPLSKLDTQISMRFAKEIGCDYLDYDCTGFDFIYTIRANSPIIGGPSAGAAATLLTISLLSGTPLKDHVSLTGTINSGGLIGPVGGIKEKIEAGAKDGLKTILIPYGENIVIDGTNKTINLTEYGTSLGVKIIQVDNLNDALKLSTGKTFKEDTEKIKISENYINTMKGLADDLCSRNKELKNSALIIEYEENLENLYEEALNLSKKGEKGIKVNSYYSAASYCFGSNVKFKQLILESKNFSNSKYYYLSQELLKEIHKFEKEFEKNKIKTISDLESYMVVKDRLADAIKYANNSLNSSNAYSYSYALERLNSAYSWSKFFNHNGRFLSLNEENLKYSCRQRISESEERVQYIGLYFPFGLESVREEISEAYEDYNNQNYELCLFKASKAKARANIILTTIGITDDYITTLIQNKIDAAERVIVKAESKGIFPILGYSYYEYANSLKESDHFSALLYAEYALELSNLEIYFENRNSAELPKKVFSNIQFIALGILVGFLLGLSLRRKHKKKRRKKRKLKKN